MAGRGQAPPAWILADELVASGFAGVLARSFAFGATAMDLNAVFWHWAPGPPHQVRVLDPESRLPRIELS